MANLGFYWRFNPGGLSGLQRTAGSCASTYTPVVEKRGFWANNGRTFLYAVACFGVSVFILVHGWNNGLALGGPCYYVFAAAAPVLWGVYAVHVVRQHYLLRRVAGDDENESETTVIARDVPHRVELAIPDVTPGDTVHLACGMWGETERRLVEMEHVGGDHFVGHIDVGRLLGGLEEGVIQYHAIHQARGTPHETQPRCLLVRVAR